MSQRTVASETEIPASRDVFQRTSKRRNAIIVPESSKQRYHFEIESMGNIGVFPLGVFPLGVFSK